ncbi:MAG TPA: hypothetical protein VFU07_01925 [Candidatus Lumbricidophila sp.]|nr:hypothetical protein [Candidatus Lumbricidophila sp.]
MTQPQPTPLTARLRRAWWKLRRTRTPLLALIAMVLLVAIAGAVRGCAPAAQQSDAAALATAHATPSAAPGAGLIA